MAFRGELSDFAAFYERTYQRAFRTALAIVHDQDWAADLAQQSYLQAFRERDAFRGEAPAEAWLHRIVVRVTLSAVRRRGSAGPGPIRWIGEATPPTSSTVQYMPTGDRLDLIEALAQLEPRYRAAVVLRYYHDYDYATIARILDTSEGNVGSMLSRSLDRLRIAMGEPGAGERADGAPAVGSGRP